MTVALAAVSSPATGSANAPLVAPGARLSSR